MMKKPFLRGIERSKRLAEIKEKANDLHCQSQTAWRGALDFGRQCGDFLLEAKRLLGGRGKWGRWVRGQFDGSQRTARVYMRIAKHWDDPRLREARLEGIELKSIQGFLRFLRRDPLLPKKQQEVRDNRRRLKKWFADELEELSDGELEVLSEAFFGLWEQLHAHLKQLVCAEFECDYYKEEDESEKREIRQRIAKTLNDGRHGWSQAACVAFPQVTA